MMFDSDDECDLKDILEDDEDDDDDDDDYIPGKRDSDSDPEYGKRKKKSSRSSNRYVPGKRNRGYSGKSEEVVDVSDEEEPEEPEEPPEEPEEPPEEPEDTENKNSPTKQSPPKSRPQKRKKPSKKPVETVVDLCDEDIEGNSEVPKKNTGRGRPPKPKPSKKSVETVVDISDEDGDNHSEAEQKLPTKGRPAKQKASKPKTKSPAKSPRTPKAKKQKTSHEEPEESAFSLRRSGRSSRARSVSYADADVSEEDMYEDEDLFETLKDISNEKKVATKKKHVDDLWSKFKSDTDKTEPGEDDDESAVVDKGESENADENTGTINIELKSENGKMTLEEKSDDTSMEYTDVKLSEPPKKKEIEVTKQESETVITEKSLTNTYKDKDMDGNDSKPTSPQIACVEEKESPVIEKAQYSSATNMEIPAAGTERVASVCGTEKEAPVSGKNKESIVALTTAPSPTIEEKNGEHVSANVEKYNSNGLSKLESPLTKTENKSIDAIIKKDTVIIEEKQVSTASSSSSTTNINPNSMEPALQPQEASSLPKTTTDNKYRSSGINNFLSSGVKKSGGLSSVLNTIEKKKKISVLDKTKNDWDSYKSDLDIEEELKGNRNAGYLDRQEFLQRADYKQWETEREMRLYSNRK